MNRKNFLKKGIATGVLMGNISVFGAPFEISVKESKSSVGSVLWEELTWPEIKNLAEQDAVVIIPVGSIEQHGPFLPVSTDSIVSSEVSRRVAEIMNNNGNSAVVIPKVWTGNSSHHMLFPGTVSFDYNDFANIIKQICVCVKKHGFSRIVFINGHGGNTNPIRVSLIEINEMLGRPAFAINYWDAARDEMEDVLDTDSGIGHSGEAETSLMLALRPELVKRPFHEAIGPDQPDPEEIRGGMAYTYRTYKDRTKIGVIGNAASATKEKGERIFNAVTNNLAEFLMRKSLWDITL